MTSAAQSGSASAWSAAATAQRARPAPLALVVLALAACGGCAGPPPPITAPSLTTGPVITLAAAGNHTCALLRGGRVACWGAVPAFERGDAERSMLAPRPAIAPGLEHVTALATTMGRVCALDERGAVWCWGENLHGAIRPGQPVTEHYLHPTRIDLVKDVRAITTSEYQTCALEAAGRVLCWGQRHQKDGMVFVAEDDDPVELVGGRLHHCARLRHGEVSCWGAAQMGLLGDDDNGANTARARISDVVRIAIWGMRTCAWLADGSTACWGQEPGGNLVKQPEPRELDAVGYADDSGCRWTARGKVRCANDPDADLDGIVQVVAGSSHRCALSRDGAVSCWGQNHQAQLADGTRLAKSLPHVIAEAHARALAMSPSGSCIAFDDDTTVCQGGPKQKLSLAATSLVAHGRVCGRSESGRVRCLDRAGNFATDVEDVGSFRAFSTDWTNMLAIRDDGTVASWPMQESDWYRQMRDQRGAKQSALFTAQHAKLLEGVGNIVAIAPTPGAFYVVDRAGSLLRAPCRGGLSSCNFASALQSVAKLPLEHARDVVAGGAIACALTSGSEDDVVCFAQPRTPSAPFTSTLDRVAGVGHPKAIAVGQSHACALREDGRVLCWGRGDRGEMGDGAFTPTAKPMLVPRLERVVELGAAASETCARTSEGKVVCWGGIDRTDAPKPVRVALLP